MQEEDHIRVERQAERASGRLSGVSEFLWTLLGLALLIALQPAAGYGNSESAQEHFRRGTKYFQLNQLDKAENEFLECLQIAPNSPQVYNNLGTIYFTENRLAEAVSAFTRAYRMQPHNPDISFNLGLAQYKAGHCPEALPPLKRAVTSQQHSTNPHVLIGAC